MNTLNKEVAKVLPVYVDGVESALTVVSEVASNVLVSMTDTAKTNIAKAVKSQDITKAKSLVKSAVYAVTGLDNKAHVASFKRAIAPKYYDRQPSEIYNGVAVTELVIDGKFCYEMDKSVLQGMKSESGKYGEDGETIHRIMKKHGSRESIQNRTDTVLSRFGGELVKAVLKEGWDVTTVAGTKQPCAVALKTKFDTLEGYYKSNMSELSTQQAVDFKTWIAKRPNFLK
tara:strand:- start:1278 stop:1964 length:687 start_codon:yes stop_codon:yes gene_type:complete